MQTEFPPWAMYHSEKNMSTSSIPGKNVLLPLIPQPVHTLQTQYHCMKIIQRTANFLNPEQTPVDCCDAPVYALTKEIQFRLPKEFGADKYFSLFGGLHIEQHLLIIHGELIKGSDLQEILEKNKFSILGTGAAVNANHIKQARYCLQVIICVIYGKLTEARNAAHSELTPIEWLKESIHHSKMCYYWHLILSLEFDILLYVRSLRESNFLLHVQVLRNMMKCFFAFDHFNYARWLSVHLYDLMNIHLFCPDVYNEFMNGNFAYQKSGRKFSKISPDQVHEQNNEVIKGLGGTIPFLNREHDSGLMRWELSGTEVARLLNEFENGIFDDQCNINEKHHENTPAFHKRFISDVRKLESCFPCNPFELNDLSKINNFDVRYGKEVNETLTSLQGKGELQFLNFFENRLVKGKEAINDPIKKNFLLVPSKVEEKHKKEVNKMIYSTNSLTKLREAIHLRSYHSKQLFATEIFGVAQSLAGNSETLYHGTKSDILKCFSSHNDVVIDKFDSAIIHDLSILVKSQYVDNIKTFNEPSKHLYSRIAKISEGYKRCDVVADRYFPNSLKGNLRKGRGLGTTISFSGDTKLPSDFKDFLGNSENKTNLNQLLVKCFIEEHTNNIQTFVVTFNDTVLSNQQCLYDDEDISNCSIEEADQRLVRHAYNCIRNEISSIVISTNDTDVIMLLIANFPIMLNINCGIKLYCLFGLSDNKKTFFINELAAQIGFEKCKGLSFFILLDVTRFRVFLSRAKQNF